MRGRALVCDERMHLSRGGAVVIVGVACCSPGCMDHERPDDGGMIDAPQFDGAPDDAPTDARRPGDAWRIDAAACATVASFRRCDGDCAGACDGVVGRCDFYADVCRLELIEQGPGCECAGSWMCATNSQHLPPDAGASTPPFQGTCMPIEFCQAAPLAGLPIQCVFSDGTPFEGSLATGPCAAVGPSTQGCGHGCGDTLCAADRGERCIGVSSARASGLCTLTTGFCEQEAGGGPSGNGLVLGACAASYGETCGCLVPTPQRLDPTGAHERAWPVPVSACRAYAAAYPATTRCVDGDWAPL